MGDLEDSETQFQLFRDCLFSAITTKLALAPNQTTKSKRQRSIRKETTQPNPTSAPDFSVTPSEIDSPSSLAEFSEYLASEIFSSLPPTLRTLTYHISLALPETSPYTLPLSSSTLEEVTSHLPPSVHDTLTTYSLTKPPETDTQTFLHSILTSYLTSVLTTPPPPSTTRPDSNTCELCSRTHLPLTYHHLIPRSTHAKVLKRKWHEPQDLNNVAWLCRACHSFVHGMCGNEELAREWFTVERIREREGTEEWVAWVGGVRWKKR